MNPKLASIDTMKHAAMTFSAVLALAGLSGAAGNSRGASGSALPGASPSRLRA